MSKSGRNEACWCGSKLKYKKCHASQDEKVAGYASRGCEVPGRSLLKTEEQIEVIRRSSAINVAMLDFIALYVTDGVTTGELDQLITIKPWNWAASPHPWATTSTPRAPVSR